MPAIIGGGIVAEMITLLSDLTWPGALVLAVLLTGIFWVIGRD